VRALGDRLFGLCCLGLALACACSVFPDSAVLPLAEAEGGSAGTLSQDGGAPTGEAGEGGSVTSNGGTTRGGSGGSAAATGGTGSGGSSVAEAGAAGQTHGGTGGSGTTCAAPQFVSLPVKADLWIGSAKPNQEHEGEALVYVAGSPDDERRTLLGLALPAAPEGAVLLKAELVLVLVSNADVSKGARRLALRLLEHVPDPPTTSWNRYTMTTKWTNPGGDLGALVAETQLVAGTTSGRVAFEVTEATRAALQPTAQVVPVVILESDSAAPSAPAELAFTSLEGNASGSALELTYCEP
jgi:hypothetical protein